MKTYWPFLLAIAIVVAFVVCYLKGWTTAAWIMAAVLIAFPVVYVGVVIVGHESSKLGKPPSR